MYYHLLLLLPQNPSIHKTGKCVTSNMPVCPWRIASMLLGRRQDDRGCPSDPGKSVHGSPRITSVCRCNLLWISVAVLLILLSLSTEIHGLSL